MTTSLNQLQELDALTLQQWLNDQKAVLIDVREPGEYANEHITGAASFPLSSLDPSHLVSEKDKIIALYCQSGRRSAQAGQKLLEAGFPQIAHLKGGIGTWTSAGFSTKVDKNAPISLFRQVQIVAGSLVFLGTVLGVLVSPKFLILSGFVGCGLIFAGITNTCAMGMLLAKLPYNQRNNQRRIGS
jgi:rhodanese-related sulfurtransferase